MRLPRFLATAATIGALAACTASTPTSATRPRDRSAPPRLTKTRFLAFGDSLTAGTTSPAATMLVSAGLPQSYPANLLNLLRARYFEQAVIVENAGMPAEGAEAGALRLPQTLQALTPEVVILLHGANDLLAGGLPGVPRTVFAIEIMVRHAKLAGVGVILCSLPPQRPGGSRAADPLAVATFNDGIRNLAVREGVILADLAHELDLSAIGLDGLHPTDGGYVRLAHVIFDIVRAEFADPRSLH